MADLPQPDPFLALRVHDLSATIALSALCAGYEQGSWRVAQFATHLMNWLPEFALTRDELERFNHATGPEFMRRAAASVYDTDNYTSRGEFGEILLHVAMRQILDADPAISKIFFKDSANDTVKGFDSVHVVPSGSDLELWLGEAKFYKRLGPAIRDAVESINEHFTDDYLRKEFQFILNKVPTSSPHKAALDQLLNPNTSLDEVFKSICVPAMLTYDSKIVGSYAEVSSDFEKAFEVEVRKAHLTFSSKPLPTQVRLHLFLVPLGSKQELVTALHEKLMAWQNG